MKKLGIKYPLPDDGDEEVENMPSVEGTKVADWGKPRFSLELPEGVELPDTGVLKLRYKVVTRTEEVEEGECRCDVVVEELVSADGPAPDTDSAEEALEKYARAR